MLQRTNPELLRQLDAGVDLTKPSVKGLAYLLRNRQLWPKGFEWNYECCDTCAMGLAVEMWGTAGLTAIQLGMSRQQISDVFYGGAHGLHEGKPYKLWGLFELGMSWVKPNAVAKRLESCL